jgi:hypothetical protein
MDPSTSGTSADPLQPFVLTLRIIVTALALGVVAFAAATTVIRSMDNAGPQPAGLQFITLMALGFTPVAFVISRIVPAVMTKTARAKLQSNDLGAFKSETELLAGQYISNNIVAAALLEGTAFFNLVAYMIEGHPLSLGLGVGLALAIMSMFPTRERMANWIAQQTRLIGEEKMLR